MATQVNEGFRHPLDLTYCSIMFPRVAFMIYSEDYKRLQKRILRELLLEPTIFETIQLATSNLGTKFCMGFFHSIRKRKIVIS